MRRDDGSASSQLLRRSFFLRRRGLDIPRHLSPRQFLQRHAAAAAAEQADGLDDASSAVASLAMEVAGVSDPALMSSLRGRRDLLLRSQSTGVAAAAAAAAASSPSLGGPGSNSSAGSAGSAPQATAEDLLQRARESNVAYEPEWATAQELGFDEGSKYDIRVERNSYPNVAILPQGGSEGRPVRAREPLPQVNDSRNHSADGAEPPGRRLSSLTQSLRSHGRPLQRHHMTHHERRKQPVGFRVSFSRPYRSKGTNMGGAYLVGVVSSGFSGFNERNVLQSSHHFWGIDDSGNKYEGPYSGHSSRGLRRIGPFRGMDVDVRGGRRPERVLFGSRDVITVLYDPGSRALSFWKDDVPMGTLVYGVRSDVLYPVAVPFNCGVTVAITSISADPNAV